MYHDDRHHYNDHRYYPGHDPFDSPPRITHIHTNVQYGGPASGILILDFF